MKKLLLAALFTNISAILLAQNNVGIGTNTPNPNAILDITSTSKGLLIPRMSSAQRITLAGTLGLSDEGLMVYDTVLQKFFYWDKNIGFTGNWNQVRPGSLTNGTMWIGDATNTAAEQSMSGDVTLSNTGVATIQTNAVQGTNIALAGETTGNIMQFNGIDWVPVNPNTLTVNNIYTADGSVTGNRAVTMAANNLNFNATNGNFIYNPSGTGKMGIGGTPTTYKLELFGSDASINSIRVGRGAGNHVENAVVGNGALSANTSGMGNTAVGYLALNANTSGSANTASGVLALTANTIGESNTAVGTSSMASNDTGSLNTAIGELALASNTSGNFNSGIGVNALGSNTTGSNNTALGFGADVIGGTLTNATAIGANAKVSASNSLVLGSGANVGIGISNPTNKLEVVGNTKTTNFQMTSSAANNFVLRSDASGNGAWVDPSTLTVSNIYTADGSLTGNRTVTMGANNLNFTSSTGGFNITTSNGGMTMGNGSTAINTSAAFGANNTSSGGASFTTGTLNTASGSYSMAVGGQQNTASGYGSFATGVGNFASGGWGFVVGKQNYATAERSFASGEYTVASGLNSSVFGMQQGAYSFGEHVVGIWGTPYTPTSTSAYSATDRVFNVGNGSSSSAPSDAFTILKNGNTGIGISNPTNKLEVVGKTKTDSFQLTTGATNNYILRSDASGNGTWVNPSTLTVSNIYTADGSLTGNRAVTMAANNLNFNATNGDFIYNPSGTGKMGIGGTPTTYKLEVLGSDASLNGVRVGRGAGSVVDNTAVGNGALSSNITGATNTAMGSGALSSNTSGSSNVANGFQTLFNNSGGFANTAIGYSALYSNATGSLNIANGYEALYDNTSGNNNIAIGSFALNANSSGSRNVATGSLSLFRNSTGNSNTANGTGALSNNTSGNSNVAVGDSSLFVSSITNNNTAIGSAALRFSTTGTSNAATGFQALYANTSGSNNTALGFSALAGNVTGGQNVAIGSNSGLANNSGTGNTFIGYNANPLSNNLTNATAIGADAVVSSSNSLILGNGANVGIGIANPTNKLEVIGNIKTTNFQMTTGAANNFVLRSDASGNGTWVNPNTLAVTNTITNPVNTITSTVNGVSATAPAVNSVSNTSSANTISTTVNGVTGSTVPIINTNTLTVSAGALTSTVNGVASSPAIDLNASLVKRDIVNASGGALSITNGLAQLVGATNTTLDVLTNTQTQKGIVSAPGATANKDVWGTDATGNPAWRDATNMNNVQNGININTSAPNATATDPYIELGGSLVRPTTITTPTTNNLTITNSGTANTIINLSSTGDLDIQDNGTSALFVRDDANVGIGTNTPAVKAHINGGLATTPTVAAAGATITIPANVSTYIIANTIGTTANAVTATSPVEGQILTILNLDDQAATFASATIPATTGVGTFQFMNSAWRVLSVNSSTGNNWTKANTTATPAIKADNQYVSGKVAIGDFSSTPLTSFLTIKGTGTTPTITNPLNNEGLILEGFGGSAALSAQLRITTSDFTWADDAPSTFLQVNSGNATKNLTILGGTFANDINLNRTQLNSNFTSITDQTFDLTPVPSSLLEARNNTASKNIFNIIGAASQTGDYLNISTSSTTGAVVKVNSTGNMGIGTITPDNRLTIDAAAAIAGSTNTYPFAIRRAGNTELTMGSDASLTYLQSWNSRPLLINGQGNNVGIGLTTTPNYKLSVNGTIEAIDFGAAGSQNIRIGDDAFLTDLDLSNTLGVRSTSSAFAHLILGNTNSGLVSGGTENYVHAAGTQTFGNGGQYIFAASQTVAGSTFGETGGFYADGNTAAIWSPGDGNGGQPAALLYFMDEDFWDVTNTNPYDNTALKSYINAAGALVSVSDSSKKQYIKPIQSALNKITHIGGYDYQFKLSPVEIQKGQKPVWSSGVLAQEVEKQIPTAVEKSVDGDYFVNYSAIIPYLIESIKEQQAIIDDLKKRLEAIEQK